MWLSRAVPFSACSLLFLCCLFALLGAPCAEAENLIPCPDCGKPVSRRAVSCPNCGCPGQAIAEAVLREEREKSKESPRPVVQVRAGDAAGLGVAIEEDGVRYVLFPVAAMGTADALSLTTVQGKEVPYSQLEMAKEPSLVRFHVTSESLSYLRRSAATGDAPASVLDAKGLPHPSQDKGAGAGVVRLDANGAVLALTVGGNRWTAMNQPFNWSAVEPARFREQAMLLARLASHASEPLSAADRRMLEQSDWVCFEFRDRAQALLKSTPTLPPKKHP